MLQILQGCLGNVFLQGERATLRIVSGGAPVEWKLVDLWGGVVASGRQAGDLDVPTGETGWYELSVSSEGERARSRLAILAPFDPGGVEQSPFGVMTHFSANWSPDLIEVLAKAGIQHVRDEVQWAHVEQERGHFAVPDRCDRYMALLAEHHMQPLTPLTFGNPLYDPIPGVPAWASAPYSREGFEGYARYAVEVLRHYGSQIRAVEIWNEYNGGFSRGPADGKPEVYAAMLRQAYRAIKRERPDVLVLAGDTIGIPLDWLETVIQQVGIDRIDGISVHPYGYLLTPEHQGERIEALRALIRKHNHGKDKPIWVTEQGWYTTAPNDHGNRAPITELTQAQYLVRAWTLFLAHGVEKAFWYLGRDDQSFGTMGLVGKPDDACGTYAPKPAFVAYATLIRHLNGAEFAGRDETQEFVHSYRFVNRGRELRVVWATQPTEVEFPAVLKTDIMGNSVRTCGRLRIDGTPVFLEGRMDTVAVRGTEAPPRRPAPPDARPIACTRRTIAVDGDLSDWEGLPGLGLMNGGDYVRLTADRAGDHDLSGEAWVCWDDEHLYFAAKIRDDTHDNDHHGGMTWKGDNIQLGFSVDPPWTGGEWSNPWREFGLALTPHGPEFDGLPGAALAVRRHEGEKSTVYEAALPWKGLSPRSPCPAQVFGLGIYVNDADGNGRKGFWRWGDIKCLDRMRAVELKR